MSLGQTIVAEFRINPHLVEKGWILKRTELAASAQNASRQVDDSALAVAESQFESKPTNWPDIGYGQAVVLGDRVLVMSPRPGRIVAEHRIDLPRPRQIDDAQVNAYARRISADVRLLDEVSIAAG